MTANQDISGNSAAKSAAPNGRDDGPLAFPFAHLQNPMVGFAHMHAVGMRMLLSQQHELLGFLQRRCEQDLRLLGDIAAAKEPQAMMEAMTDFCRNAAKDYTAEIGRSVETMPHAATAAGEATAELVKAFAEPTPASAAATVVSVKSVA